MLDCRCGGSGGSQLFARYREPVWRFFRRRVPDGAVAEELAQDVFAAVLAAAPRYEPRAPFRRYLFGIAYNVLMADRRKRARQALAPVEPDTVAQAAADPDDGLWVRAALDRLDPVDREVLMLREYEQLSYQEIADLQRIPLNTTGRLSDVLDVEREISRVRGEIERMEASRQSLDRRITYAVVTLAIAEQRKAAVDLGPVPVSTRLRNALVDGYTGAISGTVEVAVVLARIAPTVILWTLILGAPAWLLRRHCAG